jgi:hypothetical protein
VHKETTKIHACKTQHVYIKNPHLPYDNVAKVARLHFSRNKGSFCSPKHLKSQVTIMQANFFFFFWDDFVHASMLVVRERETLLNIVLIILIITRFTG